MPIREHYHRQPSHADRQTTVTEALTRLEAAVTQIQDSDGFRHYLDAQARFHHYSFGNVLLILSQRPDATQVAGYRTWQSLGRQVRRGERGIRILVPMRLGARAVEAAQAEALTDGDHHGDTSLSRGRLVFGVGSVFDVAQTEGEPLPKVEVPVLAGEQGGELYGRLEAIARTEGLTVERGSERLRPAMMGFYAPEERRIVLAEAAPRQMTKTLAHELAHHFSQATTSSPEEETLAESVAYVVCGHFGLDTGERSFPYVAIWSREPKVLKGALTRIQAVSGRIIDRAEATADPSPAARSHVPA